MPKQTSRIVWCIILMTAHIPSAPCEFLQDQKRENRLGKETSPYLLLHKHNPVDWYPWGQEAFERARAEQKPIFLSIGYSSCYWCHVMERESFSDPGIAKTLNEKFICIKVDREELPDVDENYMTALQVMGIRGGWPLSAFLTPDRKPFFGGTYWPPQDSPRMTGFATILSRVDDAWKSSRDELVEYAGRVASAIRRATNPSMLEAGKLSLESIDSAVTQLKQEFDPQHGGFGYSPQNSRIPKFPQPPRLQFLANRAIQHKDAAAQSMLLKTLDEMAMGGIWDHLGYGFHRYSTDRYWRVPHFEKMLYDNAQLTRVYLRAFELTKDKKYQRTAEQILSYVSRDMTAPEGGFYSAQDAEAEHEEGSTYVWKSDEIRKILGEESFNLYAAIYGLDSEPNFEDARHVLLLSHSLTQTAVELKIPLTQLQKQLEPMRTKLLARRADRPQPLLDTKIMTDWNGLMIAAFADAAKVLSSPDALAKASKAAQFILDNLRDDQGNLLHVYASGRAKIPAYLDDYAYLIEGLVTLHDASSDQKWIEHAKTLVTQLEEGFWDKSNGGYFSTSERHDTLMSRIKSASDSVRPSGNSVMTGALLKLAEKTGDEKYLDLATRTFVAFRNDMVQNPRSQPLMIRNLNMYVQAGHSVDRLNVAVFKLVDKVRANVSIANPQVRAGATITITTRLSMDDGWHINANPASLPQLVATNVQLSGDLKLESVTTQYPKSVDFQVAGFDESIKVYEKAVTLTTTATIPSDGKTGKHELIVTVKYQACDDSRCLAPQSLKIPISLEILSQDR